MRALDENGLSRRVFGVVCGEIDHQLSDILGKEKKKKK
jgi:hypothetical protein